MALSVRSEIIIESITYENVINSISNPAVHITMDFSGLTPGKTNGLFQTSDISPPVNWVISRAFTSTDTVYHLDFTNANLSVHPVVFFQLQQLP